MSAATDGIKMNDQWNCISMVLCEHTVYRSWVYKLWVLPQGNAWHIDTILFSWHLWLICLLYLLVFWCSAMHSSLLTTALYSVEFNWVIRCFTSFLVERDHASGLFLSGVVVNYRMPLSSLVCNRVESLSKHKGQIQSNLVEEVKELTTLPPLFGLVTLQNCPHKSSW